YARCANCWGPPRPRHGRGAVEFCRSALSTPDAVGRLSARLGRCAAVRPAAFVPGGQSLVGAAPGGRVRAVRLVPGAYGAASPYPLSAGARYALRRRSCRRGGRMTRLDRLELSYFSTKRDRSGGWMQLTVGSAGGRAVKIDSSLDGFHDVVERAAEAANVTHLPLSRATRADLRAQGMSVSGQTETQST